MRSSTGGFTIAICLAIWALACVATANDSHAQSYPNRAIKIIVPFPPGGNPDIAARIVGDELSKALKQPVVIENRPGASGGLGASFVAHEAPDGYTLLGANLSVLAINPAVFEKLNYDPIRDFVPIAQCVESSLLLIASSTMPFNTVKALIDDAKKAPGQLTYSSSGNGTASHLAGVLFNELAGTDIRHIPYRGASGAANDVASGIISINFGGQGPSWSLVATGRAKALALTGSHRSADHPETPTVIESGLREFNVADWTGILAPAKTPRPVVELLNAEINKILKNPDVIKKLAAQGQEPRTGTPEDFAKFIGTEMSRWGQVARRAGVKIEQ